MENEPIIHIDTTYKKRNVKVHLKFSENTDDKNAKFFYNGLIKIYLEKREPGAIIQE